MIIIVLLCLYLKHESMLTSELLLPRNPVDSQAEAFQVPYASHSEGRFLIYALLASGFTTIADEDGVARLLPCSLGTFSNNLTRGTDGCTECPPGKLYHPPCSRYFSRAPQDFRRNCVTR